MHVLTQIKRLAVGFGRNMKTLIAYISDAVDFGKYAMYMQDLYGSHEYRIMLLTHSLEKGMCMENPHPFGIEKSAQLYTILIHFQKKNTYEYKLGCSILEAYIKFYNEHNFKLEDIHVKIIEFLQAEKDNIEYTAGRCIYSRPQISYNEIAEVLLTRRSVRQYENLDIKEEDLLSAIRFFSEAPSACNRQMCKVYRVVEQDTIHLLDKVILGNNGFDKKTVNYFLITYDISAFDYSGERSQGLFNAGLAAMQFVNGLHLRGIGSCFMEWSNDRKEDKKVRKQIGLPKSERIAVVVGAGYYLESSKIAASCRRPICDIYKII